MNKFSIFILCLFSILVFSCKKNHDSPSGYYLTMNIGDKSFSFNDSLFASTATGAITSQIDKGVQIEGYGNTTGRAFIVLSNNVSSTFLDLYDSSRKTVNYFTVNAIVGNVNGGQLIEELIRPNPTVPNAISVTVSNTNSTYIEGSFGGVLQNVSGSTEAITNGHFKVPFK